MKSEVSRVNVFLALVFMSPSVVEIRTSTSWSFSAAWMCGWSDPRRIFLQFSADGRPQNVAR